MNPAIFILIALVVFIIALTVFYKAKGNKPYLSGKRVTERENYLSGKSTSKRIPLYRGPR